MSSKPRFVGEKVKLGSCFSYIKNGYNVKQGKDKGGIPITRIETLSDDRFNRNKVGYADIFSTKGLENRVLEDGDILMSHINSLPYLGRSVMYRARPDEVFIHGMNLLRLKADRSIVEPAYAELYFRTPHFKQQILKIAKKAVNQASISVSNLKELDFPLMSLHDQHVVIERLSLIITQMEQCERTTKRLDSLVKSQFVEMFGTYESWKSAKRKTQLDSLCWIGSSKRVHKEDYVSDGVPFFRTKEIVELSKGKQPSTELYIAPEQFKQISEKNGAPNPGDLLITAVGTIGVIWVVDERTPFYFKDGNLLWLKPKETDSIFLKYLLEELIASDMGQLTGGTAYKALTIVRLSEMEIVVPPLALQQKFAAFVSQVDKSRFIAQQQIEKLQMLYDSLAQDYFGD